MNLVTGWPDRVFCINPGDSATGANCRTNSAYTYPEFTYGYGEDSSGNRKYKLGAPYYNRILPTEFCADGVCCNVACAGTCPLPVGACCLPDGSCEEEIESECLDIGGDFRVGDNSLSSGEVNVSGTGALNVTTASHTCSPPPSSVSVASSSTSRSMRISSAR